MGTILSQVFAYLFMVIIAYTFKKIGIMKEEHGRGIATLIINLTLPCAIISGFRGFTMDNRFLIICLLGVLGNLLTVGIGFLFARGNIQDRKLYMLGMSGYNIGNFAIPFAASFIGSVGVVACSLFDVGNVLMCIGFNMTLTIMATSKDIKLSPIAIAKDLLQRPAFTTYIVLLALLIPGIRIPDPVFGAAEAIGRSNGPLAMFMLGLLLEISFKKEYINRTILIIAVRLVVALFVSFLISLLSFVPYEMKKACIIICFAPIASASTAYIAQLNGDSELSGFVSSITMIEAMILIPVLSVVL